MFLIQRRMKQSYKYQLGYLLADSVKKNPTVKWDEFTIIIHTEFLILIMEYPETRKIIDNPSETYLNLKYLNVLFVHSLFIDRLNFVIFHTE